MLIIYPTHVVFRVLQTLVLEHGCYNTLLFTQVTLKVYTGAVFRFEIQCTYAVFKSVTQLCEFVRLAILASARFFLEGLILV